MLAELPPTSGWDYHVIDLDGRGDLAFVRGRYEVQLALPGTDASVALGGSSVYIWRQQADGGWKIEREIWHSDDPTPAP